MMRGMATNAKQDLGAVSLFRGLSPAELQVIASCLRGKRVPAGAALFDVGDPSDGAYILRKGALVVELPLGLGRSAELARLGPGTVVGELCLVEDGPRSLRVRALEASSLSVLDRTAFARLRATSSPVAYKVLRNVCTTACERLRSTNHFIESELRGERWSAVTEAVLPRRSLSEAARGYLGRLFGRAR